MSVHSCREFIRYGTRKPESIDRFVKDRLAPDPKISLASTDLDGKIQETESILQQALARTATIKTNQEHDDVWNAVFSARKLINQLTKQRQALALLKATKTQPVSA